MIDSSCQLKHKTSCRVPWTLLWAGVILLAGLAPTADAAPPPGYRLDWADEFNGTTLDTNRWIHWLPGKRRSAINTADAVSVGNGMLSIATYTAGGKHYTGMISTQGKFEPVYGYFESRIRFCDSPGMWSAFWFQSPTMGRPVGDPAKAGLEIDVSDHCPCDKTGKPTANVTRHTLHWDGYGKDHKSKGVTTRDLGLGSGFHIYGFEWSKTEMKFYIDGQLTWSVKNPVSQAKEFIIFSSEIEDGGWTSHIPTGGYGDLRTTKTRMEVDYIRYYAKVADK